METLDEVRRLALAALMPPPRLRLSEWVQSNLRLPEDVSAVPGAVRLWKPQIAIADAIGDPALERVTVVKPVRVGFTTLLTGAIGSFVANEPSPILVVLPTEDDCRRYMVSDIEPIFDASPALRGLLLQDTRESNRSTLLDRRFPGGSLKIVAAKAPRNLRSHNAKVLIIDEADAIEPGAEGSPIALAERRTLSFANRKIVIGSTPVHADTSNVLRSYSESDQRVFEVPCPSCGTFTEIEWRHIEWGFDKPETAGFRCPGCEELIHERHKAEMVAKGGWRITAPQVKGHAGFRLNALVSGLANASWGRLAAEFLKVKDDPAMLQPFVNTIFAQGWRDAGDDVSEGDLMQRVEDFDLNAIPPEVLAITIGVDVQDDRLEVSIIGWDRDSAVIVLAHVVILGSPDDDMTWAELDELLRSRWQHPHGGQLKVDAAVIDSGDGDWTEKVYSFCFPRWRQRVLAGKGMSGSRPAIQMSKSKTRGGSIFIIGVDTIKTTLMNRLARGRAIRFSKSLQQVYFEQLTSERKVLRYVKGRPVHRFERKKGMRAESLDCLVYAFAARQQVQLNFDQRSAALKNEPGTTSSTPGVIKSSWMNRS